MFVLVDSDSMSSFEEQSQRGGSSVSKHVSSALRERLKLDISPAEELTKKLLNAIVSSSSL